MLKFLAGTAMAAGLLAFGYGVAAYLSSDDPLAGLLLLLVAAPASLPLVLGFFMYRGRRWALTGLRVVILLVLGMGFWLTYGFGLGVFSFAPFSVPFILVCVVWLVLSFVGERLQSNRN